MSDVSQWNVAAASNTSSPPDGAPEGMAPSTVNDVLREIQAAVARLYGDIDGTLESGGTGNAYTLTSTQTHAALADQSILVFRVDRANTGAATLNVDGLGAKSMRVNGTALASGQLVADKIVIAAYNATDDAYDLIGAIQSAADLVGELDDARLSANVPLLDAANTFEDDQTISRIAPALKFNETDATTDNKNWDWIATAESFRGRLQDDALTTAVNWVQVDRTGTTVDSISFSAPVTATSYGGITEANLVDKSATETISGSWTFSGNVTMSGNAVVAGSGDSLGFYGSAGDTKKIVSGSRDGNAALASLLGALELLGLINDGTTSS